MWCTIHQAFLAERMLEMNKQKQTEVRGFLGWLESYLGAKVDDLTPKTKLQSYYEHDYESFRTPPFVKLIMKPPPRPSALAWEQSCSISTPRASTQRSRPWWGHACPKTRLATSSPNRRNRMWFIAFKHK